MLRLGELLMVLAPLAGVVGLYLVLVRGHRISRLALVLAVLAVFAFGGGLVWLGEAESLNRDMRYVPAMVRNGEVVQGHGE